MSLAPWKVRAAAVASAVVFVAVAFTIRAVADGALEQHSGTALYGSIIYAAAVFVWPRAAPLVPGAFAIGFCWFVECAQVTGIPADLSSRSLLARLALGVQFDPIDLAWYPAGIIPLVALHWLLHARSRPHPAPSLDPPQPDRTPAT